MRAWSTKNMARGARGNVPKKITSKEMHTSTEQV